MLPPFRNKQWIITENSESFLHVNRSTTVEIPVRKHCGSFGFKRKHHIHEGIDLYVNPGEPVYSIEDGIVIGVENFTGIEAVPPSPWWNSTKAALVRGCSGVIVYGEISTSLEPGSTINAGDLVGHVIPVLKRDKGRPTSMLHVELHCSGSTVTHPWEIDGNKPSGLLDPTPLIIQAVYYKL